MIDMPVYLKPSRDLFNSLNENNTQEFHPLLTHCSWLLAHYHLKATTTPNCQLAKKLLGDRNKANYSSKTHIPSCVAGCCESQLK